MHFTVLSAIPLPQDITAAMSAVPVDEVMNFMARKFSLMCLAEQEPMPALDLSPVSIDRERWECLVEGMVSGLLAPYNENSTDIAHMEFDDRTDEGRKTYEQGGADCVRTPDGRVIPCVNYEFSRRYELHDGKVYRWRFGRLHHRKQTKKTRKYTPLPNYPFKKLYPTFETFMTEHWGCERQEGTDRYGWWFNPNAQWDWWQIGGRWPFRFLVKEDCPSAVTGEYSWAVKGQPERKAPEGYRWAAGARKADIAWDLMREFYRDDAIQRFRQFEAWFQAGQVSEEHANRVTIKDDGLVAYGDYLYRKGEDLEKRLYHAGISEQHPYPISTFACVDAEGWSDQGWSKADLSDDETQAWFNDVTGFISKQPDDALLVSVDCHT